MQVEGGSFKIYLSASRITVPIEMLAEEIIRDPKLVAVLFQGSILQNSILAENFFDTCSSKKFELISSQ
jgi:hypothetical protein